MSERPGRPPLPGTPGAAALDLRDACKRCEPRQKGRQAPKASARTTSELEPWPTKSAEPFWPEYVANFAIYVMTKSP